MSYRLSFYLGFDYHNRETNKLQAGNILHSTLFTLYYELFRPELSTPETRKGRGPS